MLMTAEMPKDEQHLEDDSRTANEENAGQEHLDADGEGVDRQVEADKYKSQAEEYLQLLQRVQADFDNFRRRTTREREDMSKYCSMRLVTNLLPVLDNFERALAAGGNDIKQFMEGMELVYRQLKDTLLKEGVKAMEPVGQEFDPNFHEAVMQAASEEHADNTVMEEFQKGYLLSERVIRPAMVKVAKS